MWICVWEVCDICVIDVAVVWRNTVHGSGKKWTMWEFKNTVCIWKNISLSKTSGLDLTCTLFHKLLFHSLKNEKVNKLLHPELYIYFAARWQTLLKIICRLSRICESNRILMWTRPQDNILRKTPSCQNSLPVCHYCLIFHSLCQNVIKSSTHKFWNSSTIFLTVKILLQLQNWQRKSSAIRENNAVPFSLQMNDTGAFAAADSFLRKPCLAPEKSKGIQDNSQTLAFVCGVGSLALPFIHYLWKEKRHMCLVFTEPKFIQKVQHLAVTNIVQGLLFLCAFLTSVWATFHYCCLWCSWEGP